MKVLLAYWSVVAIWSTTPLAIAVSNKGLSFWSAGALRLLLATSVVMVIVAFRRAPFLPNRQTFMAYLVSSLGLSPQLCLVYWAAQYVPTGVVSIVFSLSPCFTYLASLVILPDTGPSLRRLLALLLAVLGMGFIYFDQLSLSRESALGIGALVLSTSIFAFTSVWLKKISSSLVLDPFCQTGGALLFALPVIAVAWLVFDGQVPDEISMPTLSAVVYLALCGSVLGFTLYFYILRRMNVVSVSLITLITPLMAMAIGTFVLDEPFSWRLAVGALTVLYGLVLFEGLGLRHILGAWRRLRDYRRGKQFSRAMPLNSALAPLTDKSDS